ncbi:MAG TPA: HypC/HybG/HupF family hydrogenase formation chaperone [Bacteroidota bacterium]|nr:HypC/HybG/HupF family hydrogenase formation chaperone [Bacteroidota bacterium]
MCLAIPGRVIEIERRSLENGEVSLTGKVDFGGIRKSVSLDFVPDAAIEDYVIVHAGVAISKLDVEEAEATLKLFGELEAFERESPRTDPPKD